MFFIKNNYTALIGVADKAEATLVIKTVSWIRGTVVNS